MRSAEEEKNARLIAKGGGRHQEEIVRNLHHTHRLSTLMLEQSTDEDIKEKRYTKTGHEVFMKSILKENRSRSDPTLISQARKVGASPETYQVRNMNKLLYVARGKPKTPEPVVVKQQAPLSPSLHDDVSEHLGGLFQSPKLKEVRML